MTKSLRNDALSWLSLTLQDTVGLGKPQDGPLPCSSTDFFSGKCTWCISQSEDPVTTTYFQRLWISADAIIHDGELGTIALVHCLSPGQTSNESGRGAPSPAAGLADCIRDHMETASYLRHLCLENTDAAKPHVCVEVVLVVLDWENALPAIGNALRGLMEQTSLLHTIGVNVLRFDPGKMDPSIFRRAFPWLLGATREWIKLAHPEAGKPTGSDTPRTADEAFPQGMKTLLLHNFRTPGSRRLQLVENHALHLIHGPNGSGKSSLTEALELAVTGKIRRIQEIQETGASRNYVSILKNRDAGKDPLFNLHINQPDPDERSFKIDADGIAEAISPDLPAASFLLDQRLATTLTGSAEEKRAQIFLQAFFPNDKKTVEDFEAARRQVKEAESALDPAVVERIRANGEILFAPFRNVATRPRQMLQFLLPSQPGYEDQDRLVELIERNESYRKYKIPAFLPEAQVTPEFLAKAAAKLDPVWEDLSTKAADHRDRCRRAQELLERLGGWNASHRESGNPAEFPASYPERLNTWLHQAALCDLLTKELEVSSVLANLDEASRSAEDLQHAFPRLSERTARRVEQLRASLEEHRLLRDQARATLDLGTNPDGSMRRGVQRRLQLTKRDEADLNWSMALLGVTDDAGRPCGTAIREAVNRGHTVLVRWRRGKTGTDESPAKRDDGQEVTIGADSTGFTNRLADECGGWVGYFDLLSRPESMLPVKPSELVGILKKLHEADERAKGTNAEAVEQFLRRINGPLSEAINELTALMTPARWAYSDVVTELRDGKMSQKSDNHSISLRLNTAELNTFTVALFLLCGFGRRENLLKILILDDPFENMDELTTISMARALSRFLRLWDRVPSIRNWKILMLVHGEENVERMREETACAVYFLPWLAPLGSRGPAKPDPSTIPSEPSRFSMCP